MKQIPLGGNHGQGLFVLVDDEDYDKVKDFSWCVNRSSKDELLYAKRGTMSRKKNVNSTVLMHREIIKAEKGQSVDQINGNGLDNRKVNLRICNQSQNCANSRISKNNTSGYKGVCFDKKRNKLMAHITFKRKFKFLGYFNTAKKASEAYNLKAKELFGEFAYINSV